MDDLLSLRGNELNAVCFVMDYAELHFNGPVLRALAYPRVEAGGTMWGFPCTGYRDVLCGLIGTVVTDVEVLEHKKICLCFDNNAVVTISPPDDVPGAEFAHFVPGRNQPIQVFS